MTLPCRITAGDHGDHYLPGTEKIELIVFGYPINLESEDPLCDAIQRTQRGLTRQYSLANGFFQNRGQIKSKIISTGLVINVINMVMDYLLGPAAEAEHSKENAFEIRFKR